MFVTNFIFMFIREARLPACPIWAGHVTFSLRGSLLYPEDVTEGRTILEILSWLRKMLSESHIRSFHMPLITEALRTKPPVTGVVNSYCSL